MRPACSVGHGTSSPEQLLARLAPGGVRLVVDIRAAPGSRRHPHLGRDELARWLPEAGLAYRWEPRLGGFRRPAPGSPDVGWQNASFRGYAGHLRTQEARGALAQLVEDIAAGSTTFLCSETLWWRCHRRLVADTLLAVHQIPVRHLMPGQVAEHRLTPTGRLEGSAVVYDRPS